MFNDQLPKIVAEAEEECAHFLGWGRNVVFACKIGLSLV